MVLPGHYITLGRERTPRGCPKKKEAVVEQISNWNFCKDKILNYIILCGKQQLKNDLSNWQASGQ